LNTDHLPIADIDALWQQTLGDQRVRVAVVDGSPNLSHPCFAGASIECVRTLVDCSPASGPSCDHGTGIASIIFAQHGAGGIRGIAPRCRGLILPIFRDAPDGTVAPCSQVDLARAINQALASGAHVINISAGQLSSSGKAHPFLADAVQNCMRQRVLIVSAVGNDGCECLHIPGALEWVISVGAVDIFGRPLPVSNWGGPYATQGVMAPGERVQSATCAGTTAFRSGTSFATALVSGVAALLLSLQASRGESVDPLYVRAAILQTVLKCDERGESGSSCQRLLAGRLNVRGAMTFMQRGANAMTNRSDQMSTEGVAEKLGGNVHPSMTPVQPMPEDRTERDSISGPHPASVLPQSAERPVPNPSEVACNDAAVQPSSCGCGCSKGSARPQLVYGLGRLGYDYLSLSRRDSIAQHMDDPAQGIDPNPDDPAQLLKYLASNPWDASAIIWTLKIEDTPVYAIQPGGPYGQAMYERLREFLSGQIDGEVERISIPGYIAGKTRLLMAHMEVPVILPDIRDMHSWNISALVASALGKEPESKAAKDEYGKRTEAVRDFLDRVYHGFRNLGVLPQDRAINYAATNAFHVSEVFKQAIKSGRELDTFDVEPSPMCRPDAECWDVKLVFFDPAKQLERARRTYRFTVDVSDVVPVLVGDVRTWHVR
jgi:cyanobactin maturation PatA/PatG family protease